MNVDSLDWRCLSDLRKRFLSGESQPKPYWSDLRTLDMYDQTFGERIGWKWDAVLRELQGMQWLPPGLPLVDWGCGSGVAARRVLVAFPKNHFPEVHLWDHSYKAVDFATAKLRESQPEIPVVRLSTGSPPATRPPYVLVVSHVWNELSSESQHELRLWMQSAAAGIWIEPGTHETARQLQEIRNLLVQSHRLIAPCTHSQECGLLQPGQERHWCHHFAETPPHVFQSRDWNLFAHQAGIDLRALAYSYLVWTSPRSDKTDVTNREGPRERILGRPRVFKPFVRWMACHAGGVEEQDIPKRTHPELWKQCKKGDFPRTFPVPSQMDSPPTNPSRQSPSSPNTSTGESPNSVLSR